MADTKLIARIFADERVEAWRARYFWVNNVVSVLALASFLLYHGGGLPEEWGRWIAVFQSACLLVLIGETLGVYVRSRSLKEGWRQAPADTSALVVGVITGLGLIATSHWITGVLSEEDTYNGFALLTQAGLAAFISIRLLRAFSFITHLASSPLHVFLGSFAGLILIGTGLLMLPGAHAPDHPTTFTDALFTATSATCVTGLVVVDTGTAWSRFGQLVILTLIQVGGLGIMTFAAFFGLAFGRGMGVRGAAAVGEMLNLNTIGRVGRVTIWILSTTLVCEGLGVWMLYGNWVDTAGNTLAAGDQLYYSVFHSISAFCNAGFGLYDDSLVKYLGDWPVVLSISSLVVIGGLGFVVLMEVATYRFWANPLMRRIPAIRRRVKDQRLPKLSLQSKVVLTTTGALLVVGMLGFLVLEWNQTLAGLSFGDKLAASWFQSMTPRTAGFNTVDTGAMGTPAKLWTIVLMTIGGSSGSVAGGIKTTTFFVMILAVISTVRGRPPEAFRRRIPDLLIRKSLVMLVLAFTFIGTTTLLLAITESGSGHPFENVVFEAASAFCTVGLSSGVTSELTPAGRLIMIVCMYCGRIGPLTLVLAIGRRHARKFEYPEESIMIG